VRAALLRRTLLRSCYRDRTSLYFTFYAGGRFHFSDKIALTMRLGHPTAFSIGLSIFL
jgi:hypothetical protein